MGIVVPVWHHPGARQSVVGGGGVVEFGDERQQAGLGGGGQHRRIVFLERFHLARRLPAIEFPIGELSNGARRHAVETTGLGN